MLGGGVIDEGQVESVSWKDASYAAWSALPYDVDIESLGGMSLPAIEERNLASGKGDYYIADTVFRGIAIAPNTRVNAFVADNKTHGVKLLRNCLHDPATCVYQVVELVFKGNQHMYFGPSHGDGTENWSRLHTAMQFSS